MYERLRQRKANRLWLIFTLPWQNGVRLHKQCDISIAGFGDDVKTGECVSHHHRNVCSLFFTFSTLLISWILVIADRLARATLSIAQDIANRFNIIRCRAAIALQYRTHTHTDHRMWAQCIMDGRPKSICSLYSFAKHLNIIFSNYTFCWPWMRSPAPHNTNLIIFQVTANACRCKAILFSTHSMCPRSPVSPGPFIVLKI